jgi:hypothetical protein
MHLPSPACEEGATFRVDSFVCACEAEWRRGRALHCEKNRFARDFAQVELACRVQLVPCETRNTQKGEATMLKNILVILGIAAITSSSAFAATKAPKTSKPTPAAHKVAQASETKPVAAKADKKVKKETKTTAAPAAATEKAPTAEKAPAATEKVPVPAKK